MAPDNGREIGEKRRLDRLAASLRENLKRRKIQQRGRTSGNGGAGSRTTDIHTAQEALPPAPPDREA
jgi:hypothetical protein